MNRQIGDNSKTFWQRIGMQITMFLFLILPAKVSRVFVELSVYMLFSSIRSTENHPDIDIVKLNRLLNRSYNKDCVALPNYTLSWFWPDDFLDKPITLRSVDCTLREALTDDNIMRKNLNSIAKELMSHLPASIRYKLGLNEKTNKIRFKNKLVSLFTSELEFA